LARSGPGAGHHQAPGGGPRRQPADPQRTRRGNHRHRALPARRGTPRCRARAAAGGRGRSGARGPGPEPMSTPSIRAVDDVPSARGLLRRLLGPLGTISEADSAPAAEAVLRGTGVDVVITDMAMPDPDDGLRVLQATQAQNPDTPVIVITAFGNIEG